MLWSVQHQEKKSREKKGSILMQIEGCSLSYLFFNKSHYFDFNRSNISISFKFFLFVIAAKKTWISFFFSQNGRFCLMKIKSSQTDLNQKIDKCFSCRQLPPDKWCVYCHYLSVGVAVTLPPSSLCLSISSGSSDGCEIKLSAISTPPSTSFSSASSDMQRF